jgi:hypothetical protein
VHEFEAVAEAAGDGLDDVLFEASAALEAAEDGAVGGVLEEDIKFVCVVEKAIEFDNI